MHRSGRAAYVFKIPIVDSHLAEADADLRRALERLRGRRLKCRFAPAPHEERPCFVVSVPRSSQAHEQDYGEDEGLGYERVRGTAPYDLRQVWRRQYQLSTRAIKTHMASYEGWTLHESFRLPESQSEVGRPARGWSNIPGSGSDR
mgnify:CR=1 FL=1